MAIDYSRRRVTRFKNSARGSIAYRGASYPCLVEDMSEKGLFLLSSAAVGVGEELNVELRLFQEKPLACVVVVRHVTCDGIGCQIVGISPTNSRLLTQLIEEYYSSQIRPQW